MKVSAKAYGKVLIYGAYAILEPGNIGMVFNIDKGTTTTVEDTTSGRIVIDLSNFEITIQGVLKDGKLRMEKNLETLAFIKKAVECTYQYLNHTDKKLKDVKIISFNDPELYLDNRLKTGFGSSATSVVSAVAAILGLHDIDDQDIVYKISKYAHFKVQGNIGSGFDIASACYGSHIFVAGTVSHESSLLKTIDKEDISLRIPADWGLSLLPVFVYTGQPASTPELVAKVLDFKRKNPAEYQKHMGEYNQVNLQLKQAFDHKSLENIKMLLENSWAMRKKLGEMAKAPIETDKMTRLMNDMKKEGAYIAGLVGAGGGDSIIALCRNDREKEKLLKYLEKKRLAVIEDVNIMNKRYELIK